MARVMRWTAGLVYLLLILASLGLIVVAILPAVNTTAWWVRYLDFARLEFALLMMAVGVLLILLRPGAVGILMLLGLAACTAYNLWVLYPFSSIPDVRLLPAASCADGNRLRLLEADVTMANRNPAALLEIVRNAKPDVAWFQDVDESWANDLAPLANELPNVVKETKPDQFGMVLMSRLRLVDPKLMRLSGSGDPSIFTGVALPSGQAVRLYAIHSRPPQPGQSAEERAGPIMAMALAARDDNAPHVAAGDMNAVPWEDVIRRSERVGRFIDPRMGRGLDMTWNAESWILRWPLDEILVGQDFTLISLRVLPAFGSEHRPYMAELCYDPAAARDQSPPRLRPDDLDTARQDAGRGQNATAQ